MELDALDRVGPSVRQEIGAPPEAAFRLTVMDHAPEGPGRTRHTMFLALDLKVVEQNKRPADYDPRDRPWYRGAFEPGASGLTDPYRFKGVALIGYTVRAPLAGPPRGVVAGDILLTEADAFLRAQRLGRSGVVVLFDDNGRVVSHPRLSEFIQAHSSEVTAELPMLRDVEAIDLSQPLAAWRRDGEARQLFQAPDGRTLAAAFRTIDTGTSSRLHLVVMAPLDEFFAEVEAARRRMLLLTLVFVLAALPVIWALGLMMSRSMKALAAETDRLRRFEIEDGASRVRSVIREIDDLGRSVATMGGVVAAFARFVPKRLVRQLVETGASFRLGGVRREITVLFTDVESFTALTEYEDPERVLVQTSRYLAAMSSIIMQHGGTVDKFVGDGIMAIWNAPADDPDHVAHACAAALACAEANDKLNLEFAEEGWAPYRTRFGLHTGTAVVGIVGSADRMSYTALGATVNLASRVEGLNKRFGTRILVTDAVRERASGPLAFRLVEVVRPKGFESEVKVFELSPPHS